MKDTVIITGICGLIGSHVARRLVEKYNVVGIDDLSGGSASNVPDESEFFEEDCSDPDSQWMKIGEIFSEHKPRYVIHCAAMAAENLSHNCRSFTYKNNLVGEANIRNACINHSVECMVSMSSIAVMGHQPPPFTETDEPRPCDPYGISKLAGELDAKCAKDFFDLNYVIFRPHNVIGTGQNIADRYRNVASIFIRAITENKPLPIFGDGSQTRAFSPVSYVADVIAASIERPETWNQTYNIGSDEPMTVMELALLICKIAGVEPLFDYYQARKEVTHAHMKHDKVHAAFPDIEPNRPIEDVLREMLREAMSKRLPVLQKGPEIEVTKNLPKAWQTP